MPGLFRDTLYEGCIPHLKVGGSCDLVGTGLLCARAFGLCPYFRHSSMSRSMRLGTAAPPGASKVCCAGRQRRPRDCGVDADDEVWRRFPSQALLAGRLSDHLAPTRARRRRPIAPSEGGGVPSQLVGRAKHLGSRCTGDRHGECPAAQHVRSSSGNRSGGAHGRRSELRTLGDTHTHTRTRRRECRACDALCCQPEGESPALANPKRRSSGELKTMQASQCAEVANGSPSLDTSPAIAGMPQDCTRTHTCHNGRGASM